MRLDKERKTHREHRHKNSSEENVDSDERGSERWAETVTHYLEALRRWSSEGSMMSPRKNPGRGLGSSTPLPFPHFSSLSSLSSLSCLSLSLSALPSLSCPFSNLKTSSSLANAVQGRRSRDEWRIRPAMQSEIWLFILEYSGYPRSKIREKGQEGKS